MIGTSQCSSFAISNKVSIPSIKLSLPSSLIISSALVVLKSSYLIASSNLAAGVIEPSMSKVKSLKFATEAAITILRIDDSIKLAKANPQQ